MLTGIWIKECLIMIPTKELNWGTVCGWKLWIWTSSIQVNCYAPVQRREGILLCTCRSVCNLLNPIDFGITGSKVKFTAFKCAKTLSDCSITISQNQFLQYKFVQLILKSLIQLYKTFVTKNLRGHNVLQTSLVFQKKWLRTDSVTNMTTIVILDNYLI